MDTGNALTNYQRAADLYLSQNDKRSADKCLVKIAMIAGINANYDLAISACVYRACILYIFHFWHMQCRCFGVVCLFVN